MKNVRVGVIGCGNISDIYMTNLSKKFKEITLVACADKVEERALVQAKKYGILARSIPDMLKADDIDLIVNLTIPLVHAEVSLAILGAGKHVYTEKPLAINRTDGQKILELADKKHLLVGGAPDTFLGDGIQTCQSLIEKGAIGVPLGGTANMLCPGHEGWHPDPAFYYKPGGGPVFDMGPYYLTALIELLGPAVALQAYMSTAFDTRVVGSGPKQGETIKVEIPTHLAGLVRFGSGALISLSMSFDVQYSSMPPIEIWGTEGSLQVPDPNTFGGPVRIRKKGEMEWCDVPVNGLWSENSRGLGVAYMARGILGVGEHRASGARCFHVLEAMEGLHVAARTGKEFILS